MPSAPGESPKAPLGLLGAGQALRPLLLSSPQPPTHKIAQGHTQFPTGDQSSLGHPSPIPSAMRNQGSRVP